jgi:hypothetical protein
MASTYSDLKIELIGTGEQTGTWGTTTNNNFSVAFQEAITGSADVAFSSADVTVTLTNTNAAQTARNLRLNLTGTSGGARQLILGSGCQIEKLYLINNGLADAVTVKNTSGTGIAVAAGKSMFVYNDGTNVVDAITYLSSLTTGSLTASSLTLTTPLAVASGGSGAATLTGVLKGNGTSAFTAATAGTDYVAPGTATTFTATQTFNGTSSTAALKETNIIEPANLVATVGGPAITTQFYINSGAVQYYTANNSLNWTLNLTFSAGTTLNTAMAVNDSITCTLITTNTTTAYYLSTITVDTSATVTTKWQGGTAPASGNASSLDAYTFVIIKTAASTFTVLASQTKFA